MTKARMSDSQALRAVQAIGTAPILVGGDGQLYSYHDGVWLADGNTEAQRRMAEALGSDDWSASQLRSVRYLLQSSDDKLPEAPSAARHLINCANGVVDVSAKPNPTLGPHDPELYFRYKLPHDYNPKARCPKLDAAIEHMFPDPDMQALMHEVWGYCLLPQFNLKKAVLFYSHEPNTGKSTLLNLTGELVGRDNESTVSLQDLDDHRFARASLVGKLLNRSGDLGSYAPRSSSHFKSLVGGDPVLAEHKGQRQFNLHNTAKMLFAGNSFAGTNEGGAAYTSRWLVLPFTETFKPNPHFAAEVTTKEELEGMLAHAVRGAARLVENRKFTETIQSAQAEDALRVETDSVMRYVQESLSADPSGELDGRSTYRDYEEWAKEAGLRPVGRPNFYTRIADLPGVYVREGRYGPTKARGKRIEGLSLVQSSAPVRPGWLDV